MKRHKKTLRLWILLGVMIAALFAVLYAYYQAPDDTVRVMSLGGRYNQINRHVIGSKASDQCLNLKWCQLPQTVTFQTNGPLVRVYLLDMSSIDSSLEKVTTYMAASDAIAKGLEPNTKTMVHRAVEVNHGIFHLPVWPWVWHADYMLIVCADEETQVIVRVSYGK
ncbi:MAG: hypothetical protein QM703_29555 [Gemmatales bacterium]